MVIMFLTNNIAASEWQEWGTWSQCTASCGQGLKVRGRGCLQSEPAFGHNVLCPGNATEVQDCKTAECPGNPKFNV